MLKLISWNIDSLNAALTSDSPRAQLSRDVLVTLAGKDADLIAIQRIHSVCFNLLAKPPTLDK